MPPPDVFAGSPATTGRPRIGRPQMSEGGGQWRAPRDKACSAAAPATRPRRRVPTSQDAGNARLKPGTGSRLVEAQRQLRGAADVGQSVKENIARREREVLRPLVHPRVEQPVLAPPGAPCHSPSLRVIAERAGPREVAELVRCGRGIAGVAKRSEPAPDVGVPMSRRDDVVNLVASLRSVGGSTRRHRVPGTGRTAGPPHRLGRDGRAAGAAAGARLT